jgi:protein-S-isoprenylcysteine O-methyltransferase Ste14
LTVLRHALAILLLPFMALVVVPAWLLTSFPPLAAEGSESSLSVGLMRAVGISVLLLGLALFSWCVRLFARVGHGTLAPWDPTHNLVSLGPYRYVRNPMISGVALMLMGEALLWRSWAIGAWNGVFLVVNHLYFLLSEEPGLEQRFGEPYRCYKDTVPRWLPRIP